MSCPKTRTATVLLAVRQISSSDSIVAALVAAGYRVETAVVDDWLEHKIAQASWDVLMLDFSARDLLKTFVDDDSRPVSILLADSLRPEDAILALQQFGADACLEKTVDVGLLIATIASLSRRAAQALPARVAPRLGEENNIWRLSPTNWTIRCPRGFEAKLTRAETDFLLLLAREPGGAVARDRLISAMGHNPKAYDSRRLDTFVSRMRSKLSGAFSTSLPLRAVHAVGYAFVAPLQLID